METALAILMALGIYVGIPVVIGLVIGGFFIIADRRLWKAGKTHAAVKTETSVEKPAKENITTG